MIKLLSLFRRDERGVAALEMAIVLPFLLTLFLGVMEISNYVLASQRTEKMAFTIADLVTQNDVITTGQLNAILDSSSEIMKPYPFGERGHVIISAIYRAQGQVPKIAWQYEGGGTLHENDGDNTNDYNSKFGGLGQNGVLPSGFTLNEKETVIVAEVYYNYPEFITDLFDSSNTVLYKYAFYKPRLGALNTVQSQ
jgi:hypothetical protein